MKKQNNKKKKEEQFWINLLTSDIDWLALYQKITKMQKGLILDTKKPVIKLVSLIARR